jgi:hypothetical protein
MRVAYPFRKMSDGTIDTPAGDCAIFNWIDTNKTRPPKIYRTIEPSQSKTVKQPNVSAPAPNSYSPDKRESFEAES